MMSEKLENFEIIFNKLYGLDSINVQSFEVSKVSAINNFDKINMSIKENEDYKVFEIFKDWCDKYNESKNNK